MTSKSAQKNLQSYLISGEFHYFRVPKDQWKDRLRLAKDLGMRSVSIYIPWNWHEPEKGALDFTGKTIPERDLVGALEAIASCDLTCIYRPGPFITAEWRDGGLPAWLWKQRPDILSLNAQGNPSSLRRPYPAITYLHPYYLQASKEWLKNALQAAEKYMSHQGGPIINVQLDDEPSYWHHLPDPLAADYNPVLIETKENGSPYSRWLLKKYGSVEGVSKAHGAHYSSPAEMQPPRREMVDRGELTLYCDWFDFKLGMIYEYSKELYQVTRDAGGDETISMLYPYLLPLQAPKFRSLMEEDHLALELTNEVYISLFGSGAVSEQKYGHVCMAQEYYHMWRGKNGPAVTMEIQGSNASFLTPGAIEALYALSVARGIKGFNVYMLVGGNNPRGYENLTGTEYDLCAPISSQGILRPHASKIKKMARVIKTCEDKILSAQPLRDAWWGCYSPYETAALVGGSGVMADAGAAVTRIINSGDHGTSNESSLQALMYLSNVSLGCLDLEKASAQDWQKVSQLWVFSLDFMSAAVQQRLVDFVKGGGTLVILPQLPLKDEYMQDCTILADNIFEGMHRPIFEGLFPESPLFVSQVFGMQGQSLVVPGKPTLFDLPQHVKPLALDPESGKPCGFCRPVGKGKVIVLGFPLLYLPMASAYQKEFMRSLVLLGETKLKCRSTNEQVVATQMAGGETSFICVLNPIDLPATTRVEYSPNTGQDREVFPQNIAGIHFSDEGAVLLPINLPVNSKTTLIYSTWEIVEFRQYKDKTVLVFDTHQCQQGELAFRGKAGSIDIEGADYEQIDPGNKEKVILVMKPSTEEVRLTIRE